MKIRFLLYASLIALLPSVLVGYSYFKKKHALERVEVQIQKVQLLHDSKEKRQSINNLVRQEMGANQDRLLLDSLTRLSFLGNEVEALERLFSNRSFTGNEAAEKRYAFLTGAENRFDFVEGSSHDHEGVTECEISLLHPIEVDNRDIKKILNLLEGRETGPQLFFTEWRLGRKETALGSEVYELNLKILKREYHS